MNFYLTSGTPEYMERLIQKYPSQDMILLHGKGNSVVMHETEKKSVFATPRKFEVIDGRGKFEQHGFVAMQNIPVFDEARPVFENGVITGIKHLKEERLCIAYRVLRPVKEETYIIITQWTGPASFETWVQSSAFTGRLANLVDSTTSPTQNMFFAKTHTTTFTAPPAEE